MFSNCDGPVPQLCVEKSSVKVVRSERVFALLFALALALELEVAVRFAERLLLFPRLLLLSLATLAIANIRMTTPMPIKASTAPIPNSQGQTLRFCGCTGGIGDQDGGGVGCCC